MTRTIEQTGKKWKLYVAAGTVLAVVTMAGFAYAWITRDWAKNDIPTAAWATWGTGMALGFGLWSYGKLGAWWNHS